MRASLQALAAASLLAAATAFAQAPNAAAAGGDALFAVAGPHQLDRTVDPCQDFYKFSCGGWQKNNPIPADQAGWSVYGKLANDNQQFLWGILEAVAKARTATPVQQKIGDYFAACMDTAAIDKAGIDPLQPALAAHRRARHPPGTDRRHRRPPPQHSPARTSSTPAPTQDAVDSNPMIAEVGAGGLGLPDRDYYLKTDAKSEQIRSQYVAYIVTQILALTGETADQAQHDAASIMRIETALAKASLTRVDRRDPHKIYHKMTVAELQSTRPRHRLAGLLRYAGRSRPLFPQRCPAGVHEGRQHRAHHRARSTPSRPTSASTSSPPRPPRSRTPFRQAQFDFYSTTLRGVPAMPPRWKTCTRQVDRSLGEALGQEFVAAPSPPT